LTTHNIARGYCPMNTNQLIKAIVTDATAARSFGRTIRHAIGLGIAGSGIIFLAAIGPRPDLEAALESWRFLLKFIIMVPLAAAATVALRRMAMPGTWHRCDALLLAAPLCLLMLSALLELLILPEPLWMVRLVGSNSANCMTLIPLLSVVPLAFFLLVLKHGAPLNSGRAGAVAGLAAAAVAASFYALNCFDDSPLFVITWYPLATSIVVAVGYFIGNRLLKW
jgi:hypothetical protein